jgi:hypothetical protein
MDWPTALVLSIATLSAAAMFIACKIAEALEPCEYMDSIEVPPEHLRDETQLLAMPRDDYLGWNDGVV